jgi:hypothetical protein
MTDLRLASGQCKINRLNATVSLRSSPRPKQMPSQTASCAMVALESPSSNPARASNNDLPTSPSSSPLAPEQRSKSDYRSSHDTDAQSSPTTRQACR